MSDEVLIALIAAVAAILAPILSALVVLILRVGKVEVNTNSRLTSVESKLDVALKNVATATGQPLVSVKDAPTEVER